MYGSDNGDFQNLHCVSPGKGLGNTALNSSSSPFVFEGGQVNVVCGQQWSCYKSLKVHAGSKKLLTTRFKKFRTDYFFKVTITIFFVVHFDLWNIADVLYSQTVRLHTTWKVILKTSFFFKNATTIFIFWLWIKVLILMCQTLTNGLSNWVNLICDLQVWQVPPDFLNQLLWSEAHGTDIVRAHTEFPRAPVWLSDSPQ